MVEPLFFLEKKEKALGFKRKNPGFAFIEWIME